jgi:phage shock protein C
MIMTDNVFQLDTANAKWLGVCAGLARTTGLDLTLVRVAVVLATVFGLGPVAIVAYLLAAWIAPRG